MMIRCYTKTHYLLRKEGSGWGKSLLEVVISPPTEQWISDQIEAFIRVEEYLTPNL